jgi:hypothetical protein
MQLTFSTLSLAGYRVIGYHNFIEGPLVYLQISSWALKVNNNNCATQVPSYIPFSGITNRPSIPLYWNKFLKGFNTQHAKHGPITHTRPYITEFTKNRRLYASSSVVKTALEMKGFLPTLDGRSTREL